RPPARPSTVTLDGARQLCLEKRMSILTVNLLFSMLVFAILVRIYAWPKLRALGLKQALIPILLLHAFRHLGLMFLEPGATLPGIASEFTRPAAWGDFAAAVLALAALLALQMNFKYGVVLVWIFNIEGTLDLLDAIFLATKYHAVHYMGAAYWIPAFWVPA